MSVYARENPAWFRASIQSILDQSLPAAEFVLVCDGPLTQPLDTVITWLDGHLGDRLRVVRLPVNRGLGVAMNEGLKACHYEWVVRMDSDDLARTYRCERQLRFAQENCLDVVSAWIEEFDGDPANVTGMRRLPASQDEIFQYAHKRNPINHPCVLFRKSSVLAAGGYRDMPRFEDYDLWVRMLLNGSVMGNIQEPLLAMRAGDDLFRRRGGWRYSRDIARFWRSMYKLGFCSYLECWMNIVLRSLVSLMPNFWRQSIYEKQLRSR